MHSYINVFILLLALNALRKANLALFVGTLYAQVYNKKGVANTTSQLPDIIMLITVWR